MSLPDILQSRGSTLSVHYGASPQTSIGAAADATLHDTYSINADATSTRGIAPSILDLDGQTPPKYLDNPPR